MKSLTEEQKKSRRKLFRTLRSLGIKAAEKNSFEFIDAWEAMMRAMTKNGSEPDMVYMSPDAHEAFSSVLYPSSKSNKEES